MNSKEKYSKNPSKNAISIENLGDIRSKVAANCKYLSNLLINGQNILKSPRQSGLLGLIISLNNAVHLAQDLFAEGHLTYLRTYKLSQDHLEALFGYIRSIGGFNNNPNTLQFKSAYRKLLSHVEIVVPKEGNC